MAWWQRGSRPAAVLVSCLVLLVAACSDDDDAGGQATPSEPTTTAPAGAGTEDAAAPQAGDQGGPDEDDDLIEFEEIPDLVDRAAGSVLAVRTDTGEGSGVVFDDDGTAVTNAHVVGDATTVQVITAAGEAIEAEVVGTDPLTDLAVLKLASSDLPPLDFADDLPRVGSLAVAIGNPLGFENTVSVGVVSGLERSIPGGGPSLVGLLQTDAAISPGNSGGALLGAEGTVIGINVAYLPPQSRAVSIGFAIPAPVVTDVVEQLRAGQPVQHSFVGIQPVDVTPRVARQLGLDEPRGVLVLSVVEGAPADQAGLQRGDVITALDGNEFEGVSDFLLALRGYDPGDTVEATVIREGEQLTLSLTLAQRPSTGG